MYAALYRQGSQPVWQLPVTDFSAQGVTGPCPTCQKYPYRIRDGRYGNDGCANYLKRERARQESNLRPPDS